MKLLQRVKRALKRQEHTEAFCRGWDDNERDGINRNPFASGTPDWSDYERGFAGYQSWFNQQW